MPRGRSRGRGRGGQSTLRGQLSSLRKEISGHAITPRPAGPPKVNLRPYYPLVIQQTHGVATVVEEITPATITKWITNQLGFSSQAMANLVFKLKEIRCWAYQYGPAEDRVEINGEIGSLIATISDPVDAVTQNPVVHYPVLYKFQDFGTLEKPAAAGFRWPMAHQEAVLCSDSNFTIANVVSNSKNFTIHVHVEWSTAEVQPPPPSIARGFTLLK